MSWAIKIEDLSKAYRLGGVPVISNNIREDAGRFVKGLFRADRTAKKTAPGTPFDKDLPSGHFWALKDINLTINQGDVVGLIGFNGSGKSTMLKIISRITEPTKGQIQYRGRLGSLLEVGTGFHRELSGRENIFLNGAILGMRKQEIKKVFDEIVDFAEIEKFLDTPVKFYSSGMYVRLAFSVAAHLETDLLLVDEVLAVGDVRFQEKCMGKMQSVSKLGRTIIFVSHNMGAVDRLCEKGIMLRSGQIVTYGTQTEAIDEYLIAGRDFSQDLDQHPNREGSGPFRVRKIQVKEAGGNVLETVASGQNIVIQFHYSIESDQDINDLDFGIKVVTKDNQPVFFHYNLLENQIFGKLPKQGVIECHIDRLPLPAGKFMINYHAAKDLGRTGKFYDKIVNAYEMKVIEGNYYQSGRMPDIGRCVCLLNANWSLQA